MQHHPDRNPGDKRAEERFKEASEAYQVLSDAERRAQYDRFGHAAFEQGGAGFGGFDFAAAGFEDIFSDIFGDFFGGGGGRRGRTRAQRGDDLRYDLELKFEEAIFGTDKVINIPRFVACDDCGGRGTKDGAARTTCTACRGSGQLRFQQGFFTIAKTCGQCNGQGTIIRDACRSCGGAGATQRTQALSVKIPGGVDTGSRLKLRGEGEAGRSGGPPGDLYVMITVRDHPLFVRDGTTSSAKCPSASRRRPSAPRSRCPPSKGK